MDENDDTSTPTTPSTPTTNEELGVVAAQQANAQASGAPSAPIPPDDATLRLQALQTAQSAGGTPDEVIDRANTYFDYLKDGHSDG